MKESFFLKFVCVSCSDPPNDISVKEPSDCVDAGYALVCEANGNPPATYLWIAEGNESYVISEDKHLVFTEKMLGTQNYTCQAMNSYGNVSKTVSVNVCNRCKSLLVA